jgi:GDP-4-dehydro-6-deoxy-D-mannose reductase
MRALITGISGFIGSHLAAQLQAAGATVFGLDRVVPSNGQGSDQHSGFRMFVGDLLDESFLQAALKESNPTHVFHLAAVLSGAPGGSAIQYTVNVIGTACFLDGLRAMNLSPWILIASSSAVYGVPQTEPEGRKPIDEQRSLRPLTPYAASKAAQEMVAIQAHLAHGLRIVRTRTFNLIGAGQSPSLLTSSLARQVALAENGGPRLLRVGNLTPRRDYTDVRDVVRAYQLLSEKDQAGDVFNVCSGVSHSAKECVDLLMRMSNVPLQVEVESSRIRIEEIDNQVGDSQNLRRATGWRPEISFEESLGQVLDDWRQRLRSGEQ